jgi:hypothetical protein
MRCAVTGLRFMFCRHTISTWLSASKPKSCASPQSQNANPKRWSLWPVKSGGASFSARAIGRCVQPNPALKGRSNGVPPGPGHRYGVHCLWPGPGVPPLASPLARTLGSTLRYCGAPASKFKCSVCQPSVRFRSWRPFLAFAKFVATRSTCPASNAALTSFGVRESCAYRQNPNRSSWWPCMSPQSLGPRGRSCRHRIAKLPAKKVVVAFSAWSLGVARAAWLLGRGRPNPGGGQLRFS